MKIAITWQPEIADAGQYFLTIVEHGDPYDLIEITAKAFEIEDLDPAQSYYLCSVIAVDGGLTVVV